MLVSVCEICGALLDPANRCPYAEPVERAPWRGDYAAMNRGLMTHEEHVLVVSRWGMHNTLEESSKAMERYREKTLEAWGASLRLFLLD